MYNFPISSSPQPDFHKNFAFSRPPTRKISHKSDNIPFLDSISCTETERVSNPSSSKSQNPRIQKKNENFHERNDQWIQKFNFFTFFGGSRFENQSKKP